MMEQRKELTVFVTRYALTRGIQERKVKETSVEGLLEDIEVTQLCYHDEGRDWHKTREEAVKKAEEMRQKKIQSLKKQIEKIENITFE